MIVLAIGAVTLALFALVLGVLSFMQKQIKTELQIFSFVMAISSILVSAVLLWVRSAS